MEKNNSKFSISEAMKIYNGCDPVKQTLCLWGIVTLVFWAWILLIKLMTGFTLGVVIETSDSETASALSRTTFTTSMFYAGAIGSVIGQIREYYTHTAGGKYFRSVRGGFGTYSRMKAGQMIAEVCGLAFFVTVVFLINSVLHLIQGCLAICGTVFLLSILLLSVLKLVRWIQNQFLRISAYTFLLYMYLFMSACIVGVTNGKLSTVHIVLLILALILFPLVHFADLKHFRKYHWYD